MKANLTKYLVGATFLGLVAQPLAANEGTGHCHYCTHTTTTTEYSTNFFKAIITIGGLLGSVRTCHESTTTTTHYWYCGPPIPQAVVTPSRGMGPEESTTTGPASGRPIANKTQYELRLLKAQTPCYGGIVVPDFEAEVGTIQFIGLDGTVQNLPFTAVTGTLEYFLGPNFDPTGFDPAWLNSSSWSGHKVVVNQSVLMQPSLVFTAGGNPDVETTSVMNLDNPDQKVLFVDLGPQAAGAELVVLVSAKSPAEGNLLVVDGITVPIVPDTYTNAFLNAYPGIGGTANSAGQASINFPPLSVGALEGVDLNVAILAVDPVTGVARDASTFVQINLRDFDVCQ